MSVQGLLSLIFGCFMLGGVLMYASGRRLEAAVRAERWLKFFVYFLIVHTVLGCAALGPAWIAALALLILAVGAKEVFDASRLVALSRGASASMIRLVYALLGCAFLATVVTLAPDQVAFLYIVIAAFDGFSQVVGQLLGRHRLAPRLSPGKTVEGLAGGTLAALLVAWAVRDLAGLAGPALVVATVLIIGGALAGDLAASWVKRRAGIKDFSALLPGQGGMLDRFDSFIAAGALFAPLLLLRANLFS